MSAEKNPELRYSGLKPVVQETIHGLNGDQIPVAQNITSEDMSPVNSASSESRLTVDKITDKRMYVMAIGIIVLSFFPDGADSVQDHDLYVDGVLQENTGGDREMDTGVDVEVNAGARLTGHTFLHGLLDELAIFSAALDAEQINAIIDTGLYGTVSVDPQDKLTTSWGRIKRY